MEVEFSGTITMKAKSVEVAKEDLDRILKKLSSTIAQDVFGRKGIYDYDFPITTKIIKE